MPPRSRTLSRWVGASYASGTPVAYSPKASYFEKELVILTTPLWIPCGICGKYDTRRRKKSPPASTCTSFQPYLLIITKIQRPVKPTGPRKPRIANNTSMCLSFLRLEEEYYGTSAVSSTGGRIRTDTVQFLRLTSPTVGLHQHIVKQVVLVGFEPTLCRT